MVRSKSPICVPLVISVSLADALCILQGTSQPDGLILFAQKGILEIKLDQFIIAVDFEYGPLYAEVGKCVEPTTPPPVAVF